jgi:hypothetical protein
MIDDRYIEAIAAELAREYGLGRAAATAPDRALTDLNQGLVDVARTWRRILNALNQLSATSQDIMVPHGPR